MKHLFLFSELFRAQAPHFPSSKVIQVKYHKVKLRCGPLQVVVSDARARVGRFTSSAQAHPAAACTRMSTPGHDAGLIHSALHGSMCARGGWPVNHACISASDPREAVALGHRAYWVHHHHPSIMSLSGEDLVPPSRGRSSAVSLGGTVGSPSMWPSSK